MLDAIGRTDEDSSQTIMPECSGTDYSIMIIERTKSTTYCRMFCLSGLHGLSLRRNTRQLYSSVGIVLHAPIALPVDYDCYKCYILARFRNIGFIISSMLFRSFIFAV